MLAEKIRELSGGVPVYSDITMRGNFEFGGSIFERLKFSPFRIYIRQSMRKPANKFPEYLIPEYACLSDTENIRALFRNTDNFDVMAKERASRDDTGPFGAED